MISRDIVASAERIAAGRSHCMRVPTEILGLAVRRSTSPTAPEPATFDPRFYVLLQGRKWMRIGERCLDLGAGSYAVSSVSIPFRTQVTEASPETPYLGVEVAIDPSIVASLLIERPDLGMQDAPAIDVAQASEAIMEPVERLLRLSASPADIPILAPLLERELCYRLLSGPVGGTVRQIVRSHAGLSRIRAAIEWISDNATAPMCVEHLAASAGMSVTSFHRHFKAVTAHSPLAYQRHVRLIAARERLVSRQANVTSVAFAAGYASASQFSREYKRMFGVSPVRDARPVRT